MAFVPCAYCWHCCDTGYGDRAGEGVCSRPCYRVQVSTTKTRLATVNGDNVQLNFFQASNDTAVVPVRPPAWAELPNQNRC